MEPASVQKPGASALDEGIGFLGRPDKVGRQFRHPRQLRSEFRSKPAGELSNRQVRELISFLTQEFRGAGDKAETADGVRGFQ